jgi:hypothetical protein
VTVLFSNVMLNYHVNSKYARFLKTFFCKCGLEKHFFLFV